MARLMRFWLLAVGGHVTLALTLAQGEATCNVEGDAAFLLQARLEQRGRDPRQQRAAAIKGKSVYFLMVDRFARSDGAREACAPGSDDGFWCGGTLQGVIQELDYIQGMGFDCLWITPVVKQFEGKNGGSGSGSHGYWAYDLYEVDPNFGTTEDLKALSAALHSRGMCLVQDIVVNHMGPVHSAANVSRMRPFNETKYFHQYNISDRTFDEYVAVDENGTSGAPSSMWSGAQCPVGVSCKCWKCLSSNSSTPPEKRGAFPPAYGTCDGEMVFDDDSPCPRELLSPFCMPGDQMCAGYSTEVTQEGWFYDLGDLNQSDPFVRQELISWVQFMVKSYDIDVLRLDTAPFVPWDFLAELQGAVGVPILGEVTATNLSYHSSFQSMGDRRILDGVLNFPLYFAADAGFCGTVSGDWWPTTGLWNLELLGHLMQQQPALYDNVDLLGNFPDNHDKNRLAYDCMGDTSRISNFVAWTLFSRGIPIIYYGTEVLMQTQRESLWQYGHDPYKFMYGQIRQMNRVRKTFEIGTALQFIVPVKQPESRLVFRRGGTSDLWVFVNNMQLSEEPVSYCPGSDSFPESTPSAKWVDALTGQAAEFDSQGCFVAPSTMPRALVKVPLSWEPQGADINFDRWRSPEMLESEIA